MMVAYRLLAKRRWRVAALAAFSIGIGALVGGLLLPQFFSNAATSTMSTIYKTAKAGPNSLLSRSTDAPGGAATPQIAAGQTISWAVSYQNNTSANATVNMKDALTSAGAYVPNSLKLPPVQDPVNQSITPQYSTNGGTTWASGTPAAAANGVGFTATGVPTGTQQLSTAFPGPVASTIASSGGDSYNIVTRGNLMYGIYHHRSGAVVYCAQMNGTTCPGWPTNSNAQTWSQTAGTPIGTGTASTGITAWQGGTWLSGTKVFWFMASSDGATMGVACLDLAPTTPTSCGYSATGSNPVAHNTASGAPIGSSALPATNGKIYAVQSSTTGSQVVCITPTTGAACGTLQLNASSAPNNAVTVATFGNYVFASVRASATGSWQMYCYVAGGTLCSGSWPVTTSLAAAAAGPPVAPVLSTTGTLTGICTVYNGTGNAPGCWNLSGAAVANNPFKTGPGFFAAGSAAGDMYVIGTKVFTSIGDRVGCYDFKTYSGSGLVPACVGFSTVPNGANYTVRSATSIAPNCLVATGDLGQIIFFNAVTGSGCIGASGPVTLAVSPQTYYCNGALLGTNAKFRGWGALTLSGAVTGTFTDATVTLRNQNNAVIAGFDNVKLAAGGSLNLSSITTSTWTITATVTVNGVNDPAGVTSAQISMSWVGDPPEMCFQTVAPPVACDAAAPLTLSNTANAVTTSSAGNDAPGGNSTGPAKVNVVAAASQCSLAVAKTSAVQSARPGDNVNYAITVKNTGTMPWDNASFSDDLTDVLKDATYNGDHAASTGTASYAAPNLSWLGALPVGTTATVTYSVKVKSPDPGDLAMKNTVVAPRSNCVAGATDPLCTVNVTVKVTDVNWHKVDQTTAKNLLTGAEWTFTPVDGTGKPTGAPITVQDCVAGNAASCTGADLEPLGGLFRISGLGPGTYHLVETKAPFGFKLDTTPIPVTVTTASTTVALPDVVNKQLPVPAIPFTGGLGTDTLTIAGGSLLAVMLGLAGWHLLRRRKTA